MNKNKIIPLSALLIIITLLMLFANKISDFYESKKIEYVAGLVLNSCSRKPDKPSCYDVEIPKFLSRGIVTMEEAFEVTKIVQNQDRSYLFCHVLGHNLADIETKKDPDKWLDVVTRCPPLACNNGCPHGAIMRRFKGSETLTPSELGEIMPDLKVACEPRGTFNPTELEKGMCYHSMGHLAMYITGADVDRSLDVCREVAVNEGVIIIRHVCRVFL